MFVLGPIWHVIVHEHVLMDVVSQFHCVRYDWSLTLVKPYVCEGREEHVEAWVEEHFAATADTLVQCG